MLHRSFKPAKCKTSCKLATSRLKLMKNKKGVLLNQMKRDLAHLLESGQDQTARIRVEHVIREEKTMAAYELLEIYCELIVARMPVIESQKNCAIDLKEAVTSVIFAAPRCADIPELSDIKKYLTAKYGKEFASAAIELRPDCGVSRMLIEKLSAVAPDGPTKIKVLKAIAEEHNIEWEPKAFGEKDAKPPEDLLNGPTGFEKASTIHMEPPKSQAPPSQEQKHQEPINYYEQNKRFSMGAQDSASKDTAHNQSSSGTSQSDVRPDIRPESRNSGMSERTDMRQSFQGDCNSRPNWNMGFTDAASAAQAAAESAELASMAARAAAELSIQGRVTRQHSSESHKSFTPDSRDVNHNRHAKESSSNQSFQDRNPNSSESHKSFTHDPRDENRNRHAKESPSSQSFHDRNPNLSESHESRERRDENRDRHAKESLSNQSFQDRNPKSRPENHFSSNLSVQNDDDRSPNLKQNYSTNSRKSSKEDGLGAERNPKLQNERVEKKEHDNYLERAGEKSTKNMNTEQRQGHNRNSSFEDEVTTTSYSEMSIKKPYMEPEITPLTNSWQESYEPENLNPFGGEKFEKQFSSDSFASSSVNLSNSEVQHIQESSHNSSNDDEEADYEKTVVFDEYKSEESRISFDVEPTYDEVESNKSYFRSPDKIASMEKSNSDDFGTVNFDESAGPKFDSEDEFEESGRVPADEIQSPSESKPRFDFDDVRTESSVVEEPSNSFSRENSSSDSESGTGLTFPTLTGGLRNKGYRLPPYKKSADGLTQTYQNSDIANVRSSFKSTEIQNSDEKLKSTMATSVSDSKMESSFKPKEMRNSEEKLSPTIPTAVSDSDSDDLTQEQQQKPKVTYFNDDSTDSDNDLQVNIPSNRNRFGSGLSRRTKGSTTPSASGSRVRIRAESQSQTFEDSRNQNFIESREAPEPAEPKQLEKSVTSKPLTEPKVRTQIAGTSSRSRVQLRAESQSQTLPESRSQARVEKLAAPEPVPEPKVQTQRPSSRSRIESQSQTLPEPRSQARVENRAAPEPVSEPKVQTQRPRSRSRIQSQSQTLTESRTQTLAENKVDHKPSYEPKPIEARNQPQRDRFSSEKHAASKPVTEPKVRKSEHSTERQTSDASSTVSNNEKNSPLNREDSGSNNSGTSHVHPKLPDYDDVFARFQALRENRK